MGQIDTTASFFSNGTTAVTGLSKQYRMTFAGSYVAGDKLTFIPNITLSGLQTLIGAGNATGLTPVFLLTYKKKLYFLAGTNVYFSAVDAPTVFNSLTAAGNGYIQLANNFSTPENLLALAPFQGKLAIFGRNSVQTYSVAANPSNYEGGQILPNVGTLAPASVQALGELDVFFLNGTGIRTLRVRDSTLNATAVDIGSPIDLLVQNKLREASAAEQAGACGTVDPDSGRYWLFLKDTIYVLSYFPSAKVTAWCTYKPSYQATDLMRFRNTSLDALDVKLGFVNDVTLATQSYSAIAASASQAITPAKYIWISVADANSWELGTITDGLAFRGEITYGGLGFSYTSNQTAFVPQKFLTYNGQVFVRSSTHLYSYGGTDKNTYDNRVISVSLPWLDAGKKDAQSRGVDVSMIGTWYAYASMDYLSENFEEVHGAQSAATYDGGTIGFSSIGSHFSFQAYSNDNERAVLSALTLWLNDEG